MENSSYPLVSIVIPTYNHAHYLEKCLDSIIKQTYRNWEAIIVNNYSEDNTVQVVNSFLDSRIRMIYFRNNGIIAASRNEGIRNSNGEFIAFLDSDDLWLEDKLEKQLAFFNTYPETFLLYSQFLVWKNGKVLKNKIFPEIRRMKAGKIFNSLLLSDNFIGCLTVMMRNRKEKVFLFDEDKKIIAIEDYDLWLRISQSERINFVNEPLGIYRVHQNNISLNIPLFIKRYAYFLKKWERRTNFLLMALKYLLFIGDVFRLFGRSFLLQLKQFKFKS